MRTQKRECWVEVHNECGGIFYFGPCGDTGEAIMRFTIGEWRKTGKKTWQIFRNGQPVFTGRIIYEFPAGKRINPIAELPANGPKCNLGSVA